MVFMHPREFLQLSRLEVSECHHLGKTQKTPAEFLEFLLSQYDSFNNKSYRLVDWNCNTFTEKLLKFLLGPAVRLPPRLEDFQRRIEAGKIYRFFGSCVRGLMSFARQGPSSAAQTFEFVETHLGRISRVRSCVATKPCALDDDIPRLRRARLVYPAKRVLVVTVLAADHYADVAKCAKGQLVKFIEGDSPVEALSPRSNRVLADQKYSCSAFAANPFELASSRVRRLDCDHERSVHIVACCR